MFYIIFKTIHRRLLNIFSTILILNLFLSSSAHPTSSSYNHNRFNLNAICTDSETGRELYIGDYFTRPGQCIRVQCLDTLQIWQDRCQVPKLDGNCSRLPPANEFLDYPRCCSNYECKSSKSDDKSNIEETRTYDHYGRLLREHITQRVRVMVKLTPITTISNYTDTGLNTVNAIKVGTANEISTIRRVPSSWATITVEGTPSNVATLTDTEWQNYKQKFNKTYSTEAEDQKRRALVTERKKIIDEHNRKYVNGEVSSPATLLNSMSDQTEEEHRRVLGYTP